MNNVKKALEIIDNVFSVVPEVHKRRYLPASTCILVTRAVVLPSVAIRVSGDVHTHELLETSGYDSNLLQENVDLNPKKENRINMKNKINN